MIKKIAVGLLVISMVFGTVFSTGSNQASAQGMSLSDMVNLFISLGIIPPNKAAAARSAIASQPSTSSSVGTTATPTTTTTAGTNTTCSLITHDLTIGSQGQEVKTLQTKLNVPNGTGYFGYRTQAVVKMFQSNNGLPATGFVDPATRTKFNNMYCGTTPTIPVEPNVPVITNQSSPSATVIGSPTLELTYDYANKESQLTATFNVSVTAGNTDVSLYTTLASVGFYDQYGKNATSNSIAYRVNVNQGEKTDAYGRSYTGVLAGKTVPMTIVLTGSPRQMFAGNYFARLSELYLVGSTTDKPIVLAVSSNKTNSKTIIGEVSPYITSVSPNIIDVGQTMTIYGQRLSGGVVLIDGISRPGMAYKDGNGSSINFVWPDLDIPNGQHWLQVVNATTGASNGFNFTVLGSTSQPTSVSATIIGSPTLELSYDYINKESQLTATFNVSVTAGNTDVSLYTTIAGVSFYNQNGGNGSSNSVKYRVNVNQGEKTDAYGRSYTIISAGKTLPLTVVLTANPKQMFAGSYYAKLLEFYLVGSSIDKQLVLPLPSNQTNSKTIIGETSPYITSVTNTVQSGGTLYVSGQRLYGATVWIDGVQQRVDYSDTNESFSFNTPSSITSGNHTLVLKDNQGQASNSVGFNVSGSTAQPSISVAPDSSTPTTYFTQGQPSQSNVVVARINLKASGGNVLINQISIGVNPLVRGQSISNIKIYDGATLLGSISSLGNSNQGQDNQWGSVNVPTFTIPTDSTKMLTLTSDVSLVNSGSFKVGIVGLAYPVAVPYNIGAWSGFGNQITVASSPTPAPVISITPSSISSTGTVGQAFSATIQSSGATYSVWNLSSGSLPPGLYLSSFGNTGIQILGTPTQAGSYYFSLKASDFTNPATIGVVNGQITIASAPVTPTVSDVTGSIDPLSLTVDSGSTAWLTFRVAPNTTRSSLTLSCPYGTSAFNSSNEAQGDICNKPYELFSTDSTMRIRFVNTTSVAQSMVPNFYVYTPDRPSFAKGVSSQVTVNPTSPVSISSPNGISNLGSAFVAIEEVLKLINILKN